MKNLGIANEENWWTGLLTIDPEDHNGTVTYDGVKTILLKMHILKSRSA